METPNTKEFEVTGVSRSGRVRKKSSKLLDFQSPEESIQRKVYKRPTTAGSSSKLPTKHGRGRPSLAALRARQLAVGEQEDHDMADDDDILNNENEHGGTGEANIDLDMQPINSDEDDEHLDDGMGNNASDDTDDDGFGELVADLVGTEGAAGMQRNARNPDSQVRKSLYMTEKRMGKDGRLERKDKGKSRYTAYSLWAKEYRKSGNFGKDVDFANARRELWANVSNKEKNNWRRKAKIQATKAKALERAGGMSRDGKRGVIASTGNSTNSTFINRPTTSRTKKLQMQAEEKQKAMDDMAETKPTTPTAKRTRSNTYNRKSTTTGGSNKNANSVALYTNGSVPNYNTAMYNTNTPLPTIEPIDAAAHLKLLGESLTIIGERLKDHEGQIAVSGSLSVLLDSLLCSLGPLLCLTTCLPGLDKKNKLKTNLAITLDNIAYVMPGL
ncbi:uncharacterized protein LOC106093592 [Stomoxys calcitrans]|uniref:uncharacterized protein LOC106093592 n=1 Tax=Stomoxys calcitrans TaxID=35570 RepID=UPI0027E292D5|nr:uncharacterized protein LOC106093592 [Stomoxys calcitrans]